MFNIAKEKIYIFLNNLGKKIGLNLPYFVKNGFWVSLRYAILAVTGFTVSIGFARLGTQELLGQYQFVLSFMSVVSIFALLGLNVSALRSVTRGENSAVIEAVKLSFFASLLGSPIIIFYGVHQIIYETNSVIGASLILAGFLFPFFYAPNTWTAFYEGKLMFRSASVRIICINVITTAGLISGLWMNFNSLQMIAIYLGTSLFFHWIFYFEITKKIKNKTKKYLDRKYGLYVSGQKFVFSLSGNIPPLAISYLFGFEFLAIYHITYYVIGTVSSFMGALASLYMPLLFKDLKLNYWRIVFQNIGMGLVFLVVFVIFVKLFFIMLYGDEYSESVELAYYISFLLVLVPLRIFLINFFTAKKKNGLITLIFIVANIVSFLVFYATKNAGFIPSVSIYLYLLQLLVVVPLLIYYFLTASRKIDSMR